MRVASMEAAVACIAARHGALREEMPGIENRLNGVYVRHGGEARAACVVVMWAAEMKMSAACAACLEICGQSWRGCMSCPCSACAALLLCLLSAN